MRRRTMIKAALAAGLISLTAFIGSTDEHLATGSSVPPTTASPAGAESKSGATSPASLAVADVLPAGTAVRSTRAVRFGAADHEQVDADGAEGTFEVTIYNRFDPTELDGFGLSRTTRSDSVVWTESAPVGPSATIYFLSSAGVGLRISHNAASGRTTSVTGLQAMARRLAPLVG